MCNLFWFGVVTAHLVFVVLATPLDPVPIGRGFVLNEFVRHWEAARYTPCTHSGARRTRRGVTAPAPGPLELSFKAHNREFHLRLRPDPNSVFADGAEFHGTRGPVDFNTDNVYSGTLEDDESSSVYGVVTSDGLFDGTIITRHNEVYYIEPLHRYGKSHPHIHSVIYKTTDVTHPYDNTSQPCTSHILHIKQSSREYDDRDTFLNYNVVDNLHDIKKVKSYKRSRRWVASEDLDLTKSDYMYEDDSKNDEPMSLRNPSLPIDLYVPYYSENENSHNNGILISRNLSERTRGVIINTYEDDGYNIGTILSRPKSKNHVEIKTKVSNVDEDVINKKPIGYTYISPLSGNVTDSLLRHVNKRATIDPNKTTCMLYLQADHQFFQKFGSEEACIEVMTRHVQRVNSIYKVTDFNQDGKPDNITFMIKRIKVHTQEAVRDPLYRFPNNYGVEKFLELFSEEDYDGFCLAYMFTYRDFEMGTLGLAWTGDLKNAGGVCEKNGHYRGSLKSLNTGIVTLLNYGKHVPPAVSHVTLAHEIGHNFGSPHDPDVCTPGGEDGNFIMFARATSGDKKNNNHFSPCSLKSINPVLNNKARSSKGCFTEPQLSLCGNGVVEEGEECDCGWEGDCREPCCYPQRRHPPPGETPCKLTPRSLCSPSQGPCCTSHCTLRFGEQCRSDNGCRDASHCDGRRPSCPPSASKPNRTLCDDGFICYMGECTGSICIAYGLESCQCSSERACELCCKIPGPGNPCKSSFQWNQSPYDVPDLFAKPGTPCNDYNGYCDVFQKCREVDPSGPLATLRKLLLSEESLSSFRKWLLDHWYAAVLILLAVIGLLVGSTRLLGKRSDTKVKKVTIIHSSTTETVRLPDHCPDGVIVHTAVRSKVPLKKKVALKTRVHRKPKDNHDSEHLNVAVSPGKHKKRVPKKGSNKQETSKHNKGGSSSQIEAVAIKLRKAGINKNKIAIAKRKTKKEVIDYSATQKDRDQNTVPVVVEADSVGKVHNWLLNSPQSAVIPKSKSTPVGLAEKTQAAGNKHLLKIPKSKHDKGNSKSVNNLSQGDKEKVSLHVIYRPPFKFSLKLCKGEKSKMVLDKNIHNRQERNKKKPHVRITKSENKLNKSSNNNNNNSTVDTSNDTNISQPTASASTNVTGGALNQGADNISYEQKKKKEFSNLPMEVRLSQYRNVGPKWSHKKSSSVGQGVQLADSCQNLLQQDLSNNSSDMHLYENLTFVNNSPDHVPNSSNKSSSMPRNTSPKQKNKHLTRQSSHVVTSTPYHQNIHPQRIMRMQSDNSNVKNSLLNTSQHMNKGNSLNNLHLVGRKNSLSDTKKRLNSTMERTYSNVNPVNRQNSLTDRQRRLQTNNSPPETVASSGKLRRQMSATELYKGHNNRDFPMPISAGANIRDAYRPEFDWMQNKRCNVDYKVPVSTCDSRKSQDVESLSVPNTPDNQILLENNVKKHSPNVSSSKVLPSQKRQDNFTPSTSQGWPPTFSDLKNSVPSESETLDPTFYQSDMEVLVSDNDHSIYDV